MNNETIAAHAPTAAECERLDWLYLGGQMQSWYDAYVAMRGRHYADLALKANIEQLKDQVANFRQFARGSLAVDMWTYYADKYLVKLTALRAVQAEVAK